MNEKSASKLEFDKIRRLLAEYTVSDAGRELAERHKPSADSKVVLAWLRETSEAANLLATGASVPLSAMDGIPGFIALLGKGKIYAEQEFERLTAWLTAVAQLKRYMAAKRHIAPTVGSYADSMDDCPGLREELERCIRHGRLTDQASPELGDIRRQIAVAEDRIERRLNQAIGKYKNALQDTIVSKRGGHYVISVKRELRKQVPGTVRDESASGQTLFVEPDDVAQLQADLDMWKAEEERERTVILSGLSELAEGSAQSLRWNLETMAAFDFIFARAKLARSYDGIEPQLAERPYVRLVAARHPLLGQPCVPLHAELGAAWRQLIITGPNTGGKTVALKTIGLFALMAQSGLLVPAGQGTELGLFEHILADVGDGQSIEQSLSTFSAHIEGLRDIFNAANNRSLVLLDELAAGTNPDEGIALSIAVLEELSERGALVAATTHFNEIKRFAAQTPGCVNGRMAFDAETLEPLYRLEIGEAGDSYAFAIARRYGLPEPIVRRAEERAAAYRTAAHGEDAANAAIRTTGQADCDATDMGAVVEAPSDNAPLRTGSCLQGESEAARSAKSGVAPANGGKSGTCAEGGDPRTGDNPIVDGSGERHGRIDGNSVRRANGKSATPRNRPDRADANAGSEPASPDLPVTDNPPDGNPPDGKRPFQTGDCVWIHPLKRTGIVYKPADERGNVVVQVQKNRMTFNRKRLSLYIAGEKLYPGADYDMDIVFDSKENRKARNVINRKYAPGVQIVTPPEERND